MSDAAENLVLDRLRAIRGDIGEIKTDLIEIKQRLGFLGGRYANLRARTDRIAGDLSLIKSRLNLVEA
jgi:hypothetical protein